MPVKNLEESHKLYIDSLERFSSLVGIDWLESAEFWERFEKDYKTKGRYFSNDLIPFDFRMDEIRARITIAPNFTPPEEDFPGPVERWYGVYKDQMFLLTHYYGTEFNNLILCEGTLLAVELVQEGMNKFKRLSPY